MSDQSGLVSMTTNDNLETIRQRFTQGLGECRLQTVVRYTSGPQTLDGTQDIVTADTSGGSFTVDLPADPVDGDTYEFFKEVASNTLTIGRNGNTINLAAANATLTGALSWSRATWSGAANTWLLRT